MIVALHGKMGSGKSTIANELVSVLRDQYGIKSVINSFAQPIYKLTSTLFNQPIDEIKKTKEAIFRPRSFKGLRTYRELLQSIGMELRDYVHEDIWIDALFGRGNEKILFDWACEYKWWIIDDLRFLNEYNRIIQIGGKIIKVNRDIPDMHQEILKSVRNNPSELDLDHVPDESWDLIINNNRDIKNSTKIMENYITTLLN